MIKLIEKYPILSLLLFVTLMLGFTVDAQPAYQGVINDSLVEWPKSIRPSNEVSV